MNEALLIILSKKPVVVTPVFCIFMLQNDRVYYAEAEPTIKIITEIISTANSADEADTVAYTSF